MIRFFRVWSGRHPAVVRPAAQRRNPICGWPGVICPEHGFALATTADWTWCTVEDCGRFWLGSHRNGCTEPASSLLTGTEGGDRLLCAAHAERSARELAPHHPGTRHEQAG
ncbi:hypothetical protein [Amycolatopsis sp. 195334CR]|uniref:hypothetical protein n=1 Tax=Amycolatopsis sp. 195334CR TaxID=2814588 RepID=UPI001A8ED2DF|nr:hypothetical protein [Amycolatopsis sp. 195334CR]MBN6038104.1 hypothetical protein [Amycolatopsis sp. 195334CR]